MTNDNRTEGNTPNEGSDFGRTVRRRASNRWRERENLSLYEEMRQIIQEYLDMREWVIMAGGTEGPLSQDVIRKFAEMQNVITERTKSLLARAEAIEKEKG